MIFFQYSFSGAQNAPFQLGPVLESDDFGIEQILSSCKNSFYTLESTSAFKSKRSIRIGKYDLSSLTNQTYAYFDPGKKVIVAYFQHNDTITFVLAEENISKKKPDYFLLNLTLLPFQFLGDPQYLGDIDTPVNVQLSALRIHLRYSPDNHFATLAIDYFDKNSSAIGVGLVLLEKNKIKWTTTLINKTNEYNVVENARVDNDGKISLLGRAFSTFKDQVYFSKSKANADADSFRDGLFSNTIIKRMPNNYFFFTTVREGKVVTKRIFNEPDKFISEMTLSETKSGDVLLVGLYGAANSIKPVGSLYFKLTNTDSLFKKYYVFDRSLTTDNSDSEFVDGYDLRIVCAEQGLYLLAEQHHKQLVPSSKGAYRNFNSVYKDIILCAFDTLGGLKWTNRIVKSQPDRFGYYYNNFYVSYRAFETQGRLALVYNVFNKFKPTGVVITSTFSPSGDMTTNSVSYKKKFIVLPKLSCSTKEGECVFYAETGNKNCFAKFLK
ncbi:MAG: hypothetical protein JSS79_07695 [Bacteroidetes bacterium]|nr:hypothetical protein [Bacteroidota bacterium]